MCNKFVKAFTFFPLTENSTRTPSETTPSPHPFFHWAGGKREMIQRYPWLIPLTFNTYYEPFLGGGAMLFEVAPKRAVLNDSNPELIKVFEGVRDNYIQAINILKKLKERHSPDLYLHVRGLDRESSYASWSKAECAARFIYLNQTGFNGIYRVNRKGQHNVPIGSSLNRVICDAPLLRAVSAFLLPYQFTSTDFLTSISQIKKNDFLFMDPPYVPAGGTADFTRYTKEQFNEEDQLRVYKAFRFADERGAKVLTTNSNTEFVQDTYKNYTIHKILSSRSLSSKKEKRGNVEELAVVNYKVEK